MTFENRFNAGLEATAEGKLVGYAAVYNSESHDLGGFREVIVPGCFTRTLQENYGELLALVEHDTNRVLGRTGNNTLSAYSDERGLRVEITPNLDTSYGRDILALVKRGDVAGMSFRFKPFAGGATMNPNTGIRTLSSVRLKEVSVVVDPAYPATEVYARDLTNARQEAVRHALQRMRLTLAEHN